MQPRVLAIVASPAGAKQLRRTLDAVAAQTRRPDVVVVADLGPSSADQLAGAPVDTVVQLPRGRALGDALAHAVRAAAPAASDLLWLLTADTVPDRSALAALLGALEVAPSVAVAGPKLMRADDPAVLHSYGETLTRLGASRPLVQDELDQAQHDTRSDVLGVGAAGMLVRAGIWNELRGFDPELPSIDAALDFCVRVRLAGSRVVVVPSARVAVGGGPELFGRRSVSDAARLRIARAAQLHRRLVYAKPMVLPLHWLLLVPLAIVRSLVHLVSKRPFAVPAELAAALGTAFGGGVRQARSNLKRTRRLRWAAIAPLRMTSREAKERRRRRPGAPDVESAVADRPAFLGGGIWAVLALAAVGLLVFAPFVGASALAGGALAPLGTVQELWRSVGTTWHGTGDGVVGPGDPFAFVLAALGSLTFWSPSLSVLLLYFAALPLAAWGAWVLVAGQSTGDRAPVVAAVAWALAPPFLAALAEGRLSALIAHLALPWLVLASVRARRSWPAAGIAALLFALTTASAPSLLPALLIALIVWGATKPRTAARVLFIAVPALVLFAPLALAQCSRGTPLALLADPGVPLASEPAPAWQQALGAPVLGQSGWTDLFLALGTGGGWAAVALAVLLAPFAVLALSALASHARIAAVPPLVLAACGLATAIAAGRVAVAFQGDAAVPIWPGTGLSLYWLGLVVAAGLALEHLPVARSALAGAATAGAAIAALPLLAAPLLGAALVAPSTGATLPAIAAAQASSDPTLGTLELAPLGPDRYLAVVHRGEGTTLEETSTWVTTDPTVSAADRDAADLAGNLVSRSGLATADAMADAHVRFVLLSPGPQESRLRAAEALDGNRDLVLVGETPFGTLWEAPATPLDPAPTPPGPLDTAPGRWILLADLAAIVAAVLVSVPSAGRGRTRPAIARMTEETA